MRNQAVQMIWANAGTLLSPVRRAGGRGSEFMAEFEAFGLPPRSPQLNGIVERANRTAHVECWSQHRGELTCSATSAVTTTDLGRC